LFYRSTIRELYREFAAARRRMIDEENARITQAWHVVRIYAKALHAKRVPRLEPLLLDVGGRSGQTPEEMKAALTTIQEQFGSKKRQARRG